MNHTHDVPEIYRTDIPEIYRTDIPYITKCAIVKQLCLAQAAYAGVSAQYLRAELIKKVHVDFETLDHNPLGLLLLYEYLYAQRPVACTQKH
uniref:hypothetical protein n=1 Tax=Hafnia alvei TaxID=569 RepID=UPI0026ECBE4E|nr:hypothetical protein [Hafnia alvei]